MNHPGRLALVTLAAFDHRLTDRQRATNLRIALPAGYDPEAAAQRLQDARQARDSGDGYGASRILHQLVTDPPMGAA